MMIRWALAAFACIVLAACASTHQTGIMPLSPTQRSTSDATTAAAGISHITVIMMENVPYESAIGSGDAPFLNALAARGALFTNSHGVAHPSEPNYLALFSGSTQGVTSDACPLAFDGDNLAAQLSAHGLTFAGYAEDAPVSGNPCFADPSSSVSSGYLYWRKHVPWADFNNAPNGAAQAYAPGVNLNNAVNFIVPNICNDMHDCGVATGDAWLAENVPAIESYDASNAGLLVVTFDEGVDSAANHIVTILDGPMVNSGQYGASIDHYSMLHFIETTFGLPLLGANGDASPILGAIAGGASFTHTGTVGQVMPDYVHVQFGTGCGWLHVFTSASTAYSPASWRPAPGDTIMVRGSGSCINRATATEIDLQQSAQ